MRIIGGAWRGRRLASVGKGDVRAHLRPTPDRVRESLFNVLMTGYRDALVGGRVLDLFAGTGALGLEALSRGAAEAVFVESGRVAQRILRDNIALCQAETCSRILARDARRMGAAPHPFDLVFLDPPYGKAMGEAALDAAISGGWLAPGTVVVWEEGGTVQVPAALQLEDERRYGETQIRILTHR
ncbi:16S rRNA (guanine(966)-N(2))-methyltransferase RsmD [Roseovarius aestuariivivens]|uniref:16S rRNA (guanine(966)-N(2))-methyltransferase RsmD n=1 Tax=Roseovarius aestuariivivens TaxID=1888910 RepID=UPI00108137BB|nr:16S rRNA (guanine(966)-N(2))-methyltransferase RsmD [Roseovarius aestuariivivens]